MKRPGKLTLSKETLWQMDVRQGSTVVDPVNESCVQSCYLQSCGGGCTISTGRRTDRYLDPWVAEPDPWVAELDPWVGELDPWVAELDPWVGEPDPWVAEPDPGS